MGILIALRLSLHDSAARNNESGSDAKSQISRVARARHRTKLAQTWDGYITNTTLHVGDRQVVCGVARQESACPLQLTTASLYSRRFRLLSLRTAHRTDYQLTQTKMSWHGSFFFFWLIPSSSTSEAESSSRLKFVVTLRDPDVSLAILCRHGVLRAPSRVYVTLIICVSFVPSTLNMCVCMFLRDCKDWGLMVLLL